LQPYPPNYHLNRYAAGSWRTRPYTIIAISVNGCVSLTGFADDTFAPFLTRRYHSTIGRCESTTHTFRDLPIITMIIWTSLPQIESIDESRDDLGSRIASDTRQWSSRPFPTHQESKPIEREISYTLEQGVNFVTYSTIKFTYD